MIRMDRVTKVYDTGRKRTVALDGLDLHIERGEFVAVMGPSGSGKSTLLHLAGALDLPTSGSVHIEDRNTSEISDDDRSRIRRSTLGFVFQFFNLLPTLTLEQNVALPELLDGKSLSEVRPRVADLLDRIGLRQRLTALPDELSGGEMQRVAIARALVRNPPVLLADEPTGNLDSATGHAIMSFISEVTKAEGKTVVMVTHDAVVASFAQRIVRLRDGRIEEDGQR